MTIDARAFVPDASNVTLEARMALIRTGSFGRVEVTSPGDFFFEADQVLITVPQGTPALFGATLRCTGGFNSPVTLEITGLPSGNILIIGAVNPDQTVPVMIPTDAIPANTGIDLGWRGTEII